MAKKKGLTPIGKRIRRVRLDKKMTLDNIANETGLSKEFIKKIEAGDQRPSVGTILQISRTLHIDSNFLLKEQDNAQGHDTQRAYFPGFGKVQAFGQTGPIVLGGQPPAGGHHGFCRLCAARAILVALSAIVAQPGHGRTAQLVPQSELQVAVDGSREGVVPNGKGARCTAVSALHAGFHVSGAELCHLIVQREVNLAFRHSNFRFKG